MRKEKVFESKVKSIHFTFATDNNVITEACLSQKVVHFLKSQKYSLIYILMQIINLVPAPNPTHPLLKPKAT
jgi:hypothetical protein